jgi:hypothetical protein
MTHVDTPQSRVRAGVARGDITPPVGIYHRMWGAAVHDRASGVHRPLAATVLWLESLSGGGEAHAVVALDHCLLDRDEMRSLRQAAATATGISPENVNIALSHTHGAGLMSRSRASLPGGELIGPYLDQVAEEVALLAAEAKEHVSPATIVYGAGRCPLAGHRDYFDEVRGHYVCGFNPDGPADDTLLVGRVIAENGVTLATLVNYACHPTTLAWDNTAISPDWVGAMREVVEDATNAPCVFLQGASGDLGPREGYVGEPAVADRNGRMVGYAALAALEGIGAPGMRYEYAGPVLSGCWIGTWKHELLEEATLQAQAAWQWEKIVVELPYRDGLPTTEQTHAKREQYMQQEENARRASDLDRARDCRANVEQMTRQLARLEQLPPGKSYPLQVTVGRLGDALFVLTPGELYQVFQVELRQKLAPRLVFVSTCTDDWQPGYLPQQSSYGQGIYQDIIAAVAPGTLEMLLDKVAAKLEEMVR